ncbi:MAG: squalene--hopene cyclase [Gammaproteobacteria bacterium]|nr:squalene--hopene cyclase [Gammaproteobacteria bacterium]MDE2140176.1 squalene--hopene cyclase [Gammaproteobacteria bacterium]MDE2272864.1 squalene--hopene cyclase [Gammaproteobacteria bacterium]
MSANGAAASVAPAATPVLDATLTRARRGLLERQHASGHWCFEFEADCTIPAEYVLMMHYMDEVDEALQQRLARYLRAHQQTDGGWPLYPGGAPDISCSVKCYYALKLAGDAPGSEHLQRARDMILKLGGAARANVFTRIMLAQFRQIPWRGVPYMPAELILLPRWFPFHFLKVSYWSRTVMVPLLVLYSLRCQARNPRGVQVRELFSVPPERERHWFPVRSALNRVFLYLEHSVRLCEPLIPGWVRRLALKRCEDWMLARLNGEDGLGAIFPAMVNAYEALAALGYAADHPLRKTAKRALELLLVDRGDQSYCQPCVSPVWDTALAVLALQEAGGAEREVRRALDWLAERQLLDEPADWRAYRPRLASGAWAFQYRNDYYPDLDDTAAVAWAMHRSGVAEYRARIARAAHWLAGMQSRDGGFASFDADNTHHYLNEIPFADHGALLDPPTEDVTGRCVALFSLLGEACRRPRERALRWLTHTQQPNGSWWGRWGTNYIYGTWSVLAALELAGVPAADARVRRAANWLKAVQQNDGGFGETNDSYQNPALAGHGPATPEQTAWALLGLMAAGEAGSDAVGRGIQWLLRAQGAEGLWHTEQFNAPGFPRVFYLRYHGYSAYFPLWALARYRKLVGAQRA